MAEVQGQRDPQQDGDPEAKKNFWQRMSVGTMVLMGGAGAAGLAIGTTALAAGAPLVVAGGAFVAGGMSLMASIQGGGYKLMELADSRKEVDRLREQLQQAQIQAFKAETEQPESSQLTKAVEFLSGVRDRLQTEYSHLMGEKNTVEEQLKQSMEQLRQSRESEKILAAKVESLEVQLGERGPAPGELQQHQDVSQAAKVSRGGLNP